MKPVWLSMHSVFSLDSKMNDVVGIIDVDGFMIEKKFYCKELGVLKVGEEASSFIFDMGIRWRDLTPKQQRQCMFLTRNIHKLPFGVPRGAKAFHIDSLGTIVKNFYDRVKLNTLSSIAYKGGHFERDLLNKLQIPSTNLESFGCPKANLLFDRLVWLETCGHHFGEHSYQHCPKVEVEAFGKWLSDEKRKD